jgi:hypothetical protein
LFSFWRGANFIHVRLFKWHFNVPWFWRYEVAFRFGEDAGWLKTYREYEPKLAKAKRELFALKERFNKTECGIFELVEGEIITMSRARELLGETSIVPVRERYAAWLIGKEFSQEVKDDSGAWVRRFAIVKRERSDE